MEPCYRVEDTAGIITPAVLVFRELLEENLDKMLQIAGDVSRLRPHCKTHKTREVVQLEMSRGITKHKCATFAEAEMLADVGVEDIFLAYSLVGPNIARAVRFIEKFPDIAFAVTADHPKPIAALGQAVSTAGQSIDVLLDIDTGQHRTGLVVGESAEEVYRKIVETDGLRPGGLHVYDGQQHQKSREERAAAINAEWKKIVAFRNALREHDWPVPRIVAGGTASFPIYAQKEDTSVELSPGTCIYNDAGYSEAFPDLVFRPATVLLTRVISRPTKERVTLDLGYKAVASDPPAGKRVIFPDVPDAKEVLQNEEHLVIETSRAEEFEPGDELFAIPRHICPTSALHKQVVVVSQGKPSERWDIASRDRWLTI